MKLKLYRMPDRDWWGAYMVEERYHSQSHTLMLTLHDDALKMLVGEAAHEALCDEVYAHPHTGVDFVINDGDAGLPGIEIEEPEPADDYDPRGEPEAAHGCER